MFPSVLNAPYSFQFLSDCEVEVRDTLYPEVSPTVVPLHFAAGHSLTKFLAHSDSWQQCHIQFLQDHNVVYVGERGLRGGGGSNSIFHSCGKYGVYECKLCDFGKCPNNRCYDCCRHKDHGCADRQKTLHLERVKAREKAILSKLQQRLESVEVTEEEMSDLIETEDTAVNLTAQEYEGYVVQQHGSPGPLDQVTVTAPPAPTIIRRISMIVQNLWAPPVTQTNTYTHKVDNTTQIYQRILSSDPAVQQDLLHYFNNGGTVSDVVTTHYPYDQWLVRSLIGDLSNSTHDPFVLSEFRKCWLNIAQCYQYNKQVKLLQAIKDKQLDLVEATDVLYQVGVAGELGLDIACGKDHKWRYHLKYVWAKQQLTKFEEEEQKVIASELAQTGWELQFTLRFLAIIKEHSNATYIISFLSTAKENKLPWSQIEEVLQNHPQTWASLMRLEIIFSKICREVRDVDNIRRSLNKLRQVGCSVEVLERALDQNSVSAFAQVVQQLCNFDLSSDICQSALSISNQTPIIGWGRSIYNQLFASTDTYNTNGWISKVDQFVVNKLFDEPEEYDTNQLIKLIGNHVLRDHYDKVVQAYEKPSAWNVEQVNAWAKYVRAGGTTSLAEMIAVVSRAVLLQHKFKPRGTQVLTLLCLLHREAGDGILAQVNTGEGKSVIVAMLAAIKALQGKKVDVVTSSTELSVPEVKRQSPFFDMFYLTVAENSNKVMKDVYKCDVVYGTATNFLGDILRKEFLGDDCRAGRPHDVVIVDEVDCMLFDNRAHSVRLAADTPGMNYLELPLVTVWQHMHMIASHLIDVHDATYFIPEEYKRDGDNITLQSGKDWIEERVRVFDKGAFVTEHTQSHLMDLLRDLNEQETEEFMKHKVLQKMIFKLEQEIKYTPEENLRETKRRNCEILLEQLNRLPWCNRCPVLEVPLHLRQFCKMQVPYWIKNAVNAAFAYKKGAHYTVKNDRIVPIHYNETGVLQENLVWCDGLTQFLQLKEGLPLDPEGFATNFMSNISFFKRYHSDIYGLTGTLGDGATQEFLREIYDANVVVIPPYKHRKIANNSNSGYICKELAAIIVPEELEWYDAIVSQASYHAKQQRAVLVILKYISQVDYLADRLANHRVWKYTGHDKFEKTHVDAGDIIIATNIAGRGTDLKTSDIVEDHGGLYVAVTFLPQSYRVELQNVGRTAREGKKGMAQLILHCPHSADIEELRKVRQEKDVQATKQAIKDAKNIFVHDELFRNFCALESKLLPSVTACEKTKTWQELTKEWEEYEARQLSSEKYKGWLKKKIPYTDLSQLTPEGRERYKLLEAQKVSQLKSNYRKRLLKHFCNTYVKSVPQDLLLLLKNGKQYEPDCSTLAQDFNWGKYERKALEERWAIWLKSKHFEEDDDVDIHAATHMFENEFVRVVEECALHDKLVENPFYYVLKGNESLRSRNYADAVVSYDKAISLDPTFSSNARYNKARALLSPSNNQGTPQLQALEELKSAVEVIENTIKPAVVALHAVLAQTGHKPATVQHIQHQLDVLHHQQNYIENTMEEITKAQKNNQHVTVRCTPIKQTFKKDEDDHSKAVQEAAVNGLTELFTVTEHSPRPWGSILAVTILAVGQIAVGCLVLAYTASSIGVPLVVQGVSDVMEAMTAVLTGTFSWAAWGIKKATSLATAIMTSGWQSTVMRCKDVGRAVKNFVTGAETVKQGLDLATRQVVVSLGTETMNLCIGSAGQYCTSKGIEQLRGQIRDVVFKELSETLVNNQLVTSALSLDMRNGDRHWQQILVKIGLSVIKEQDNSMTTMFQNVDRPPYSMLAVIHILPQILTLISNFLEAYTVKVQGYQTDIEVGEQLNRETMFHMEHDNSGAPFNLEEDDIMGDCLTDDTSYTSTTAPTDLSDPNFTPGRLAEKLSEEITTKLVQKMQNLVRPFVNCGIAKLNKVMVEAATATDRMRSDIWARQQY